MKKSNFLFLPFLIAITAVIFNSCISENEDSLSVDCSLSDIAVELSSMTPASCNVGGNFTVNGSGGEGTLEFSIDGINFSASSTFANLSAGTYLVTVRDENGCTATTEVLLEADANTVAFEVATVPSDCFNDTGSITITATGGDGNPEFSIDGGTVFVVNNVFEVLAPGTYSVVVRDGVCTAEREVTVLSNVSLSGDIMPIINTYCALSGCHADAQSPILNSPGAIIGSAPRIMARTVARTMPPAGNDGPSDEDIERIVCWVNDGALDN